MLEEVLWDMMPIIVICVGLFGIAGIILLSNYLEWKKIMRENEEYYERMQSGKESLTYR